MYCFFFNDTATTEIYTLSLHDALPIYSNPGSAKHTIGLNSRRCWRPVRCRRQRRRGAALLRFGGAADRKSTRLNSSHANISYAVFCLKKKKIHTIDLQLLSQL